MIPAIAWPILSGLVSKLPELAATMQKQNVSERNVEAVGKIAEVITAAVPDAPNLQAAAERIAAEPEMAQRVNDELRLSRAEIMDVLERENALAQGNVKAAREFNASEPPVWGSIRFVHLFTGVLILWVIGFLSWQFAALEDNARMMVLTAVISTLTGLMGYWVGTSNSSALKDMRKRAGD